jgi:hypothetical protein
MCCRETAERAMLANGSNVHIGGHYVKVLWARKNLSAPDDRVKAVTIGGGEGTGGASYASAKPARGDF